MTTNKLVKDYLGNLISKGKARKIMGKYYEDGMSCFLLEDGQWYRITSTDKIVFDNYLGKYILKGNGELLHGIINSKGEKGYFSPNDYSVRLVDNRSRGPNGTCLNEKIAFELGYIESLADGLFYKEVNLSSEEKDLMRRKAIPNSERSKDYNLEQNPQRKQELIDKYEQYKPKITASAKQLSKLIGDYTLGAEFEIIQGHIPRRIRSRLGLKALKDGSLRHDDGEGMEIVTMPMQGPKAIELLREFCSELTKRCEVNNYCSVHFHFGKVRKDKLFVLSFYNVVRLIQDELKLYFPYSRFNTIKADGKIYCNPLPDLKVNYKSLLSAGTEEEFKQRTVKEFNKIYSWLNNGKELAEEYGERTIVRETVVRDGKKMFHDKWLKTIYTTKSVYHSVQGHKWDKACRYSVYNILNMFFSKTGTLEARAHEGSTNITKVLCWLLISSSIIKFAENVKMGLESTKLTIEQILRTQLPEKYADYLMAYLKHRNQIFFNAAGEYKSYKSIEKAYFSKDPEFKFTHNNMEIK